MLGRLFLFSSVLLVPWVVLAQEETGADTADAVKQAFLNIRGPKASQAHVGGGSSITCSVTAPEEDNFFWMRINQHNWFELPEGSAWREANFTRHVERFENGSVATGVMGFIDNFREEHSANVSCGSNNPDHQRYASIRLEFKNNSTNNDTDDSDEGDRDSSRDEGDRDSSRDEGDRDSSRDEGDRDSSRDWYYESDEFWEMPESPARCGPGQGLDASREACVDCPAGTYNFEDSRVDSCMPCRLGTYQNETGRDECWDCQSWSENRRGRWTTLMHGSTSSDQCVRPDRLISKFVSANVGFRIRVKGVDFCTNVRQALWGISKVAPFDGHFYECSFSPATEDSPNAFSAMSLETTMHSKFAWEFWEFLDLLKTHREVGNAYIKLGRPMVNKIREFLENHSELWQLGLSLNTDMLNLEDLEILEFTPYFQGQCQPGDNSKFCDGVSAAASVQRFYLKYSVTGSLINCADNAGYSLVKNIMERGSERGIPCLTRDADRCKLELVSCRDGDVIVALTNSFTQAVNNIESIDDLKAMIPPFAANNTKFSLAVAINGCEEGGATFKAEGFQVECAACGAGNFVNDAGICQKCPFGSWGEDGKICNSCGWHFATPFWGTDKKEKCIETENEWRLPTDSYRKEEYLRDVKGENRFNLTITPLMNMCGVSDAVKAVKDSCGNVFDESELTWDDSLDFDEIKLERIICMGASNIEKGFSEMCDSNWDKSWKDIFEALEYDFWDEDNLKDVVCYVFKKVRDLDTADTTNNCSNLDPSQYMMSMAAEFREELDIKSSAAVIPILKRLRNLKTMDFSSFADAGRAMMATMGVENMAAFTGWDTANELKELVFSVANGFRMAEFEFEPIFDKEEFYCENDNAKRRCWGCSMENCNIYPEDEEKGVRCSADECNNCSPSYWYYSGNQTAADESGKVVEPYSCAKCDFPEQIENGTKVDVSENGVNARYKCNDGFVLKDCNAWASCEWRDKSHAINFPTCVEDKCVWPEIPHASIWRDWKDDQYSTCPFASYRCDDGWMGVNYGNRVECWPNQDFKINSYVKCIEKCSFPDVIENGVLVNSSRSDDGRYFAEYECDEGFHLRDGEYAFCDIDKHYNNTAEILYEAVARLPSCRVADSCEFPDEIGGARKEDEWEHRGEKGARYECPDHMWMDRGNGYVRCNETDPSELGYHNFTCIEKKTCSFPDTIENGEIVEDEKYESSARYKCLEGYKMSSSDWAYCDEKAGQLYLPTCEKDSSSSCHLPEQIENGHRAQMEDNKARYECHGEWKLPESLMKNGGWVECDGQGHKPEYPRCEYGGGESESECSFPEFINGGYRYMEGVEGEVSWAMYVCHEPFVMTPNKYAFVSMVEDQGKSPKEAYMSTSGLATCISGNLMLPECRAPEEAGHCGIPVYIHHGQVVDLIFMDYENHAESTRDVSENRDYSETDYEYERKMMMMMPLAGMYECEEGYKMHETKEGAWGWCRMDGSKEIPRCESKAEWNEVEFKLHNGNEKKFADGDGRVFAGIVLANRKYQYESDEKWEYGCNDGFNGYAAGAICRSVGFNHGAAIPLTKKMQMRLPENLEFGWTGFSCNYDDTMPSSSHCHAERYEDAMDEFGIKARCFNFDKIAVKCFDNAQFNVTVSLTYSKNTINCRAMAYKEDKSIALGWIDEISAKFMIDDRVVNFKPKYNKKQGYFIRGKNLLNGEFSCLSCEVHAGDTLLGKAEKCKED
ncbi:hypothetical protein ACHWQZ_G016018 [Mnemiopsis leidyi]